MLPLCKYDLKCRILQKVSYFISTWLKSEFLSFVFVSVTAFKIFTGEQIFAYMHHWYRWKMQEHVKKIVVRLINRYRLMWNFIQQHDQMRSIRHQTYPIGLSISLVSHLEWTGWRYARSMGLGPCVKGIIFITSKGLPTYLSYYCVLGERFAN